MKYPLLFLLLLGAPLHATTILIDFGTVPTTGTSPTWNNFTGLTSGTNYALLDTTGVSTGHVITLSGGDVNGLSDNTTPPTTTYSPFTPATVIADSLFQSSARTFTLSNLNPTLTYNLQFFSYVDRNTARNTTFAIPGYSTLTLRPSGVPSSAFDSGGEVGTIASVAPNGANSIVITVTNLNENWILNGMEITYTVPEPSSAMLGCLVLIPFLRRRR